jgi:signal transduction histidine kinase
MVLKVLQEEANLRVGTTVQLERRDLDLWPLVESIILDLKPLAATSGNRLLNEVPHDMVAHADADLLTQVFQNLVSNAIQHTQGGEIQVKAWRTDPGSSVRCSVTDNGRGIPEDRLEKVFEKLETDGDKGGMGLGLAIVKQFVEAHGGQVTVESKLGAGSTFTFTIPGAA